MKKIYSFALAVLMAISMLVSPVVEADGYESMDTLSHTFDMEFVYGNMELTYNYNNDSVTISKEQITYEEFEVIFRVLSDEHLSFSGTSPEKALNPQDGQCPEKGYVEFLDENDGNWIIAFDENAVYARCIDPVGKISSHGFFNYKTATIYNAFRAFLDSIASKTINGESENSDINAGNTENKHSNQINIYDMKQIYEASFPIKDFGDDFSWGICSYTREGESSPVTVAYMTFEGMEFLRIITEAEIKNNRIIFENKRVAYFEDTEKAIEYDMNFELTCIFELQLDIGEDGTVAGGVIYFQNVYTGDKTVYSSVIDMNSYKQSGYLPSEGKISFSPTRISEPEAKKEITPENKTEDKIASAAYSDYDFLQDIQGESLTLSNCSYSYTADGKKLRISKSRTEMNVYNTQNFLAELFTGYTFTKDAVLKDFDTDESTLEITCQKNSGTRKRYTVYVCDGYIVVEAVVANEDKTDTRKNIPLYIRYAHCGESIIPKLKPHFEKWIDDVVVSDIHYTDISKLERICSAEFEIDADEEMLSSWIGEVCENGKIRFKITYFESDVMLNVSGNGKSYNLMRSSYSSNKSIYTTSNIGIDKDTPIPNKMAKSGYIHLNWTTSVGYSVSENPTVRVYNAGIVSLDPVQNGLIGNPKAITRIGEMQYYKTSGNTPVTQAEPRGKVFDDVADNHWAKNTIENHYYAGIVRGIGNRMYEPESTMTHEHFGILLKRLFGYGYSNNSQEPALRQEVFKALIDAMDLDYVDYDLSKYADASDIAPENIDAVKTAVSEGIVQGFAGALNVNSYLTRAEAITLIDRAIKTVYEIDDNVKPEYYKTYILPKNGYTVVSADKLSDFKVKYDSEDIYIMNDNERLKGKIVVTFGDDVINDSHVYAVFEVDGNVFTAESLEFSQIMVQKDNYVLRGNAVIYKNGRIYDDSRMLNVVFNVADHEVKFGSLTHTFYAYFENTRKTLGKEPKEPDIQPYEIEAAEWDGGLIIAGDSKTASINGENFSSEESGSGAFSITYNKAGNNAKINLTITKKYPDGGKCVYTFTSGEIIQMNTTEIYANFTVRRDGETVAQNIPFRITGIQPELEATMVFSDDSKNYYAELYVTETGK